MDSRRTVWITGAGGLIGNQLIQIAPKLAPSWRVVGLTRSELDLLDFHAVEKRFRAERPELVIHCAAMSKSPACQANPELARKINVDVTRYLAELASEVNFIFFSSDLVFDGKKGSYIETDEPNPLSVYAETKVAAEQIVLANPRHTTIRVSLNAGSSPTGDRSFIEEMRNAWRDGQSLKLFVDEYRCPIPASATAQVVWELIVLNKPGLYHLAGSEKLSRFEIGQLVAKLWPELNTKIDASSIREYKGAPRPADTSLNCEKLQRLLSFPLPKFSEWVGGKVFSVQ